MERRGIKEKKKSKLKLKKSRKNISDPRSKEDESSSIRSVYFDLEGDIVYDVMKYIRGYPGAGKIPEDEMELIWPILKTKSLLYLQASAHHFFDQSLTDSLRNLDPFAIDDATVAELLLEFKKDKYLNVYDAVHSIWTTKEEYISKFKPGLLTLFYEQYLTPRALLKLKSQVRVPQIIKEDDFALFSEMPNELVLNIVSYLTHPLDIVHLSKCGKALHAVCGDSQIWSRICAMYKVKIHGKHVKQQFGAHYLKPVEQVMYSHQDDFKYHHIVIPSEELRVLDYSVIQQKYMLDDITTLVLVVNMKHFDQRLEKYKYNPNYIHENIGFLRELIAAAPKHHSGLCAIVVLLLDTDREVYKGIEFKAMSSDTIVEDFPNMEGSATEPRNVLKHIVMMFKELSFDVANIYQDWKPELLVQYEDLKTQFFVDNFLRILRHMKLRPVGGLF
jgi:hypothetical protein